MQPGSDPGACTLAAFDRLIVKYFTYVQNRACMCNRCMQVVAIFLSIIGTVCNAVEKYFAFSERAGICRSASVQLLSLCKNFVRALHYIEKRPLPCAPGLSCQFIRKTETFYRLLLRSDQASYL
jgi:hypothetical protein|eukprot:COSAG06_NODE_2065_length_7685_cov_1179.280649_5_plen_124_part_00